MQSSPNAASASPTRFLLIQRDNIGDLVLSTPFIRVLRARYPQARIDALVNSYNAPVLERNPHVNSIFTYTKWKHRPPGQTLLEHYRESGSLLRTLRGADYDVAVLLNRGFSRHALRLALTSGARNVAGFTNRRGLLERGINLPVSIAAIEDQHMVQRAAALLRVIDPTLRGVALPDEDLPPCELFADPVLRDKLAAGLVAAGILPCPQVVAVQISARKIDQRWPAERFVELIHALHAKARCAVLLFWSPGSETNAFHPGDDAKARYILDRCKGLPVHGVHAMTLGETVAGFSLTRLMISSDGGAMHVAAGLRLPIVGMFGATVLDLWHPWKTRYIALRPPSLDVADVPVTDALAAACQLLATTPEGTHAPDATT